MIVIPEKAFSECRPFWKLAHNQHNTNIVALSHLINFFVPRSCQNRLQQMCSGQSLRGENYSTKGTSIIEVRRFLAICYQPTYLCPILSYLDKATYLMTADFD